MSTISSLSVKKRDCSHPDGREKPPRKWYSVTVYHHNVWDGVFLPFLHLILSYNYNPKLIALLLSNVESDQTNHSMIQEEVA